MSAAIQTVWAELLAATLVDAGLETCVISPGSRSTPIVAALANRSELRLVTLVDERTAAFFALGVARATGKPAALVCTSGTAAAHYYPAIVEASMASIPLVAITSDRPPELQACGASQTIDQIGMYGGFVRGAFDLGAPVGTELALRAMRRKLLQAIVLARGPHAGPVHVDVPLRKPLEPAAPSTEHERALATYARGLVGPLAVAPPQLAPDAAALARLARAIEAEPEGVIVVGAMPVGFAQARDAVFALAARAGYPIVAEAGSQLRFGPRPGGVTFVDRFDLIPPSELPSPRLVLQLGSEPVAQSWPAWVARAHDRWVLAGPTWHDADAKAHVVLGDVATCVAEIARAIATRDRTDWRADWRERDLRAAMALEAVLVAHPRSETAAIASAIGAVPPGGVVQIGNSLPIRVVDHACAGGGSLRPTITQRGAAGIDGLVASAAGATLAGQPTLLVLGDVSFAHDIGGLLATRTCGAPLAILVVDNRGGQIFAGLPVAKAELGAAFDAHWLTPPGLDPAAVATAFGIPAITAASAAGIATAVASALASPGVTVIHAPVSVSGAHDVRTAAIDLHTASLRDRSERGAGIWRTP